MQEIPIVLIGHRDHGKSTLIGRFLLDTGTIKESRLKEIKEVDEASGKKFELAHLLDSFKEEREREMTIDTTMASVNYKGKIYRLIDVPGHSELISNMLTGASGADAAVLLLDAEEGIKEQTGQHLQIAKLLGVEQLAVAVNKIDKIGYDQNRFEKLSADIAKVLESIGYFQKKVNFFPISALNGDNVILRSLKTPWYKGPTLMEFIESNIRPVSFLNSPLRFLSQDEYQDGNGKILVGKMESGKIETGQAILISPENIKEKVREIKTFDRILKEACAGESIGMILENQNHVLRGRVVSLAENPPKVSELIEGEIFWIKPPSQKKIMCECGTLSVQGEFLLPSSLGSIGQGEKSNYKIKLEMPIAFDPGSKTILGKIALKENGNIIGVGNIK